MRKYIVLLPIMAVLSAFAQGKAALISSPVVFRPALIRQEEKPVGVETKREIAADNGLFQRIETVITFTNPNGRVFEGELEFPLPDKATVCGYALEIDGTMVPGVVCPKETARVAFENERRKGVDPGIVEHVKGNVWKTRIYPLLPNASRKAMVAYILPVVEGGKLNVEGVCSPVVEKCGGEIFVGERVGERSAGKTLAERLRAAAKATIYWDASMSRQGKVAADRNLLECLPEKGEWTLIVFRNVIEAPLAFTSRADLLKAIDALVYDGGTCLEKVLGDEAKAKGEGRTFIFSDEYAEPKARTVRVRKLAPGEKPPAEVREGTLLATAWAANRVEDLSGDAEANKKELVEIGRKYGIASSVTSLIVLERLEQYLQYKIEPPKTLSFHDEWVRRRAAEDDPIVAERAKTEHRNSLLRYWEERIKWWKDPVPPKNTPKSGVFDMAPIAAEATSTRAFAADSVELVRAPVVGRSMNGTAVRRARSERASRRVAEAAKSAPVSLRKMSVAEEPLVDCECEMGPDDGNAGPQTSQATVKITAWNPKTPYLKAIGDAAYGYAYPEYLKQREVYGTSPAFYLDCAGWFFRAKEDVLAKRIISNLSEMKLEDMGLWRTMGWRLREAGAYDEAVEVFRHVLKERGEEPQSGRDFALVLTERGKELFAKGNKAAASCDIAVAMTTLHGVAFVPRMRRSGRWNSGNDMQTSVFALEELNGLISWSEAQDWGAVAKPVAPAMDAAFRRDLPLDLRITLSWDTDETDIDLHVLEPNGEEAYYQHRRTSAGGFVSEDVTTGYGPEEYLRKTAEKGVYKIRTNYYASHRQSLTGAAVVTATVYTSWGRKDEKRRILSLRLDKPRDNTSVGEVKID